MNLSRRRSTLAALLVAGAFSMEFIDGTVIATALPEMARSFGSNAVDLHIGMTSYLLALAVFIPVSGWLAERYGGRTIFGGAIGVFTLSSIACGFSQTLGQFVVARLVQGIGGAMMVPVGRLVVLRSTEKKDLMRAIAYITWPALAAPIIGPPLGGFITEHASWRWIFFINVPLGLVGMIFTQILIPNDRGGEKKSLDVMGFFLTGAACAALMYAFDQAGSRHVDWWQVGAFSVIGMTTGALALRHARKHQAPMLALAALRVRTFSISTWGGAWFRIVISAIPFLLPLYFQMGFGLDPFAAGSLVLAVFCGNLAMKPLTTPALKHFGFRNVLLVNGVLTAVTTMAIGLLSGTTPRAVILGLLFLSGLCRSLQLTSLSTLSFADVPAPDMGGASTFSSMIQQMLTGIGIAIGAIVISAAAHMHATGPGNPSVGDFRIAFFVVGALGFVGVVDCLKLDSRAGAEVSGHLCGRE